MSDDYDRRFSAPQAGPPPEESTQSVDREALMSEGPTSPAPAGGLPPRTPDGGPTPPPMPIAQPRAQQSPPPPRPTEVTAQMPPTPPGPTANPPRHATPMRAPQSSGSTGAHFEQQRPAPPRPATGPSPTQRFSDPPVDPNAPWTGQPNPPATMGQHRAIDALSQVGLKSAVKMPPQRGWRQVLYSITRINLGPSPDELYEMELHARIRRNARDSYQIGVFGLKGGVGKTATAVALGSALSRIRGDRILAVDADPDGGNLADRAGRQSAATITDLLSDKDLARYNDIRAYTSMNASNLEVLSSEDYSGARREFNDEDWKGIVDVVSRYYNLVLADCGTGLFTPASRGVLSTVSGMVIVASASIDGARQAAVTMDWLRQNGYQDLLGRSCVVVNHVTPGKPNVDVTDLVQQFERHVAPGRVIVLPWDKHVAAGTEIQFELLGRTFQRRIVELAAALSDDFDRAERR